MAPAVPTYRRLPGNWRGVFTRASVLAGEHHLLSLSATRFEERYRRLYFRDIRAIVVSRAVRFGIPRGIAWGVILVLISLPFAYILNRTLGELLWVVLAVLGGFWVYICLIDGVRCRVHTGVSQIDLPAIRRRSVAHRFLAEVDPLIESAQGRLPENWRETVAVQRETVAVQRETVAVQETNASAPLTASDQPKWPPVIRQPRTIASDILLMALIVDASITGMGLFLPVPIPSWATGLISFVEAIGALWVLIQYHRGILRKRTMLTAVAVLVLIGIALQGQNWLTAVQAARTGRAFARPDLLTTPVFRTFRLIYFVFCVILAVTLTLFSAGEPERAPEPEGLQ